ncbi:MAG: VOC family protein [Anaerolineae bacterium]|jgi:catechol 2,3-dioxygenase-like lactoylglutathione lyase family enzyme
MKASRILETALYVDDLDAAETFYTDVLGLAPLTRGGNRHLFFRCGDGVFLLFNPEETARPGARVPAHGAHGPGHVAFATTADEMPAWRRRLQEQGIEIEAEVQWPSGGQSLYFRDPAGNSLELATPQVWGIETS